MAKKNKVTVTFSKDSLLNFFKKLIQEPIYFFLFALYPTLSLYSQNISELFPEKILPSLIFVPTLSLVIFFLLSKLFKSKDKAALLVLLVLVLAFNYDLVKTSLPDFTFNIFGLALGANKTLVPLFGFILLFGSYLIIRKGSAKLRQPLNWLVILLLVFPLFKIFSYEVGTKRFFGLTKREVVIESTDKLTLPKDPPDVYYFIFDRYASFQNLKEFYNYDNKELADFLTEKGFYLAKASRDNYPATFLSVSSSLNLNYITSLVKALPKDSNDQTLVYPLMANYKVEKDLRALGYKYFHVGSWWNPTRANKNADKNYVFRLSNFVNLDEFSSKLLETTIFSPIIQKLNRFDLDEPYGNFDHRNRILFGLQSLKKIPQERGGPKFVFGHILLPHAPYVLDQNCKPIRPEQTKKHSPVVNYLNHIKCANSNIKEIVNNILAQSKNSIIVIQADEGPTPILNKVSQRWDKSSLKSLKEKTGILNAYYFPDQNYKNLYQTITPVNTFRLVFNQYFGANFKKLEDKIFIFENPTGAPYKLHDRTKEIFK
ncbi:MAG: sulfatase-like hydrolase/transferase [bacterium]|nr:sulfatase-like hydrolase/transferase [bacterium]